MNSEDSSFDQGIIGSYFYFMADCQLFYQLHNSIPIFSVFHRVPPGVHLLDIQSREHHFSQVKIQLLPDSMDSPKCIEYVYPGAPKQAIPHPLELTAHASYEYYEPRQGFSIMSIFKNPMLLMMIVSVGGMVMMPKMMEGLDPEQKEQMQRQMAMQQDPSKVC